MSEDGGEVPQTGLIVAWGKNNGNGKDVLYVILSEGAMQSLGNPANPSLQAALDGSTSEGDEATPGLEGWELIVVGPAGLGPMLAAMRGDAPS